MTNENIVAQRLRSIAIQENMLMESITILATVDFVEHLIGKKLLEIDALEDDYSFEQCVILRTQIHELLAKLKREEQRMDEFMLKYKEQINEKKTMLRDTGKKKPIYLRGVPTYSTRKKESSRV